MAVVRQVNLSSNISGVAKYTDPNLVIPWGLSHNKGGPWFLALNGTSLGEIYQGNGQRKNLVVDIPRYNPEIPNTPTDVVTFGESTIIVTHAGVILLYNPNINPTSATILINRSSVDANYTGITFFEGYFYVANFHSGYIEMYDSGFNFISQFNDPSVPAGYVPWNVKAFDCRIFVTFVPSSLTPGVGNGLIDVFLPNGVFEKRFNSSGPLNLPWGLAKTDRWGCLKDALIVGNNGDGYINAFCFDTGFLLEPILARGTPFCDQDVPNKTPVQIIGLFGLGFGNDGCAGNCDELYFNAAINDGTGGLFGRLEFDRK
jgi:uncharacterized protein (TIGR03118 family)